MLFWVAMMVLGGLSPMVLPVPGSSAQTLAHPGLDPSLPPAAQEVPGVSHPGTPATVPEEAVPPHPIVSGSPSRNRPGTTVPATLPTTSDGVPVPVTGVSAPDAIATGTAAPESGPAPAMSEFSPQAVPATSHIQYEYGEAIASIPVGVDQPSGVAYDSGNGEVYASVWNCGIVGDGCVYAISGGSDAVVSRIIVGVTPEGMAYDGATGEIYVANENPGGAGTVMIIADTTNAVSGTITLGTSASPTDPSSAAYDASNGYVYVTEQNTNAVAVISGTTLVATVTVGSNPDAIAYDSGNGYVYVANSGSGSVSVISGTTVDATVAVGSTPEGVAYDSADAAIYVANEGSSSVSVISGTSVATTIASAGSGIDGIAFDTASGYLYISSGRNNELTVISGASNSVIGSVAVPGNPGGIAYDSGNGYVYEANIWQNTVSVISSALSMGSLQASLRGAGQVGVATGSVIPVGTGPSAVAVATGDGDLYATNYGSDTVSVVSGTAVVGTVNVGAGPVALAYDSANGYVYVANAGSNSVSVLSGTAVVATIGVGTAPDGVAYDNWSGDIYVSNGGSDSVSIISQGTNRVVATIPVGTSPAGLAYTFGTPTGYNGIYIANTGSDNMSVIIPITKVPENFGVGAKPTGVALDNANGDLLVTNRGSDTVDVVVPATTVAATIHVGGAPYGVAYDSANGYAYVTDSGSDSMSIVSTATNSVVGTVATQGTPEGVAYDPVNGDVYVADNTSGALSVYSTLASPSQPTAATLDAGQSLVLSAPLPGIGTGNGTSQAVVSPAGGLSCTMDPPGYMTLYATCIGSVAGSYTVTVTVVNSVVEGGTQVEWSVYSALGVTVSSPLTLSATAQTPTTGVLDVGQTASWSTSASGGTGSYTYHWASLPAGCADSGTASNNCNPGTPGSYSIVVQATDGNANTVTSAPVALTVFSDPTVSTLSPNVTSADVEQDVTFSAVASGGSGTYTGYAWTMPSGLGCTSSTNPTILCRPDSPASSPYPVSVTVTDSTGTVSAAATTTFKVYADPNVAAPSASIPTADVGTPVTFMANPTGGTGTYHFVWAGLPTGTGCTSANLSAVGCTPDRPMQTNVTVTITDTNGFTVVSRPTPFTVHSVPVVSLAINRSNLDDHESLLFYANASGGTGVYTYSYTGLPTGCTNLNTSRLNCTPSVTGTFTVNVTVTDTGGGKGTSNNIAFVVAPDPTITSYWFWEGSQVAYANESLSVQVNFTGGMTPYTLCFWSPPAWTNPCASGQGGTNFSFAYYHYGKDGTYPATANITDATGWEYTLHFNESVYYPILVTPPSVASVHEGDPTNASFSIYNMHGAPPMVWWLNDTTRGNILCGPVTTSVYGPEQCSFTPSWNGTDQLNLTVKDALHARLFVTFAYSVPPPLRSLTLTAATNASSTGQGGTLPDEVGSKTSFSATWSGGNGAYTCTLAENGSVTLATQTSSTPSCSLNYAWAHPAAYTVILTVADTLGGAGGSVSQSLFVDVISRTSILTFTPSATTVDAGVNDNLSVTYTGGYPSYSFSWNFGNGILTSTSVPWVTYAWTQAGTYSASVTITDSLGVSSAPAYVTLTVGSALGVKSMGVSDGPIAVTGLGNGGSVAIPVKTNATFNMTAQGGLAPFNYTWTVNGHVLDVTRTSNLWTAFSFNWSTTGNLTLNVTVTDSQGETSTFLLTVDVKVDMVGPVTLTLTQLTLDAGMWDNASLSWSGGWAPYRLHYHIITSTTQQWLNTTSPIVHMMWNGTGPVTITATVVDAFDASAWQNVSFTVNPDMTIPCAPTYSGVPLPGNNLTFTLGCLSGGTGPFTYRWTAGNVIVTTNVGTVGLGFTADARYNVSVNVTDAAGRTVASKTVGVVVDQIGPLTIRPSAPTTDVGVKTNLSLSFTGGIAPFAYHFYIVTPTRSWWQNGSSPVLQLVVTTPGNTTVRAIVEDAYGRSATQNLTITENADPAAPCAPTYSGIPMPGNALTFTLGCLSGGTGPFTFVWTLGGTTRVTASGTVNFTFAQAGTFDVSVNVTDAQGLVASSKTVPVGTAAPSITDLSYHVLSVKPGTGMAQVTLNVSLMFTDADGIVNGYRWGVSPSLGNFPWEPFSQDILRFNMSTGNSTFFLFFQVRDSFGRTSSTYAQPLNVSAILSQSDRGNQSTNGYDALFVYGLLAAVIAAAVAIAFGLVLVRRRRKTPPSSGDPDHSMDAISREIHSRTDGKWVEENELVQGTSTATGKDHTVVRDKIRMLCDNNAGNRYWLEKQDSAGNTEYRWGGSTAFHGSGQNDSVRIALLNQVMDEAFSDPENAGGVTGADLLARGADSGLEPVPEELEWLSCLGDRVQAGKVIVASGQDFNSTVWRLKIAKEECPDTAYGDVRVDERSFVSALDEPTGTGIQGAPPGRTLLEDGEGGPAG